MLQLLLLLAAKKKKDDPVPVEDKDLSGSITGTKTLDASVEYMLVGPLIVEDGGVLNIPAGTIIKAKKDLVVIY